METEIKEKLGFVDILKRAAKLVGSNISLVVFAFFISLPLFCFLIFFELSLQNTLYLASEYLFRQGYSWRYPNYFYEYREPLPDTDTAVALQMLQTSLLYFLPYHLLDLFTTTAIVGASSAVYISEERMGLGLLIRRSVEIGQRRFSGCLITSLYVLLFSTSAFFGFISGVTNYYFCVYVFVGYFNSFSYLGGGDYHYRYYYDGNNDLMGLLSYLAVVVLHGALFVVLTAKFSKWSAGWNMSLIVSVLEAENEEGVYGSDALSLSACYSRGLERQGLWLMLVFFVNALVLRLPCFYAKCSASRIGVLYTCVYAGLLCVGNVLRWVACVVFYHESRNQFLEKKADLEVGTKDRKSANLRSKSES